ncbi:Methanol dehydrogenase activator [Paraconexibacter sp. AEG42_29]|uniref:Methanol dehydrogenase activator n=1 Tax=Paraconexibacter sp. AEG42_29 TaxID=2997339 RepID=A0AAU7AXM8_9ACTN
MSERDFEPLGGEQLWQGRIIGVREERFRYPDGEVVSREIVVHPGAVAIVVHDDEHVFLIRQPREAVGEPDMLEIPAGRLDKPGEDALPAAQRELAEEIGRAADHWELLKTFYPSVGMNRETVHVYRATGLSERHADSGENERIELVAWPLDDLDGAIAAVKDAKTLIGLLLLRERLSSSTAPTPG